MVHALDVFEKMNPLPLLQLLALAVSLTSCSVYDTRSFLDYESGAQKAAKDIATGRYARMDNVGIIRNGTIEMRDVLKRDYGIESIEGFRLSSDYVRGYHTIMSAAAEERYR